ncbi:DUF732 domain-containing protein [Mycolicibacterium diernhoferi]|uniref:DUF732 domain-containing protein n=1 Tax=Mycolicibacterium diernhoferi TaxID=1801 RepID=A0A1Q4H5M0_9MYCO|nr:DUF732 domain-containing protein [Mycolicibacterium diernhoferi]OJZ62787.1 hypothetical protein BRW64_25045 [Mycolicibacterium diernhoferi]OPE53555.1 hypothetical protein BV510_14970 [Mycolicibacterium diernhoferi]PEG55426.1 DUF732 domain-containing protein [Mycolicibacterium diernhoferi]QYL24344.1 DUF732 domain-containing protein [Mycolicibacterium diernhoferi]
MRSSLFGGLTALAVTSAALLGAAPAGADPNNERAYLNALTVAGLIPKFYTEATALESATNLCRTMDTGVDQLSVVDDVMATDSVPEDVASFVVGTATVAFCPEHSMSS